MQTEFWLEHWRQGRIGFHRDAPLPLLVKYWQTLELPRDARVLVPLAGKSLDMIWLAEQGYRVLGVELSPLAVAQFLQEHGLQAQTRESEQGVHHVAGNIELIQGDVFALTEATLAGCDAVYDRAAIVALPPAMRERYARDVYDRLPVHCRGLMITFDYPQSEMSGPPFSVPADDIEALFGNSWQVSERERDDVLASHPDFQAAGLSSLHTLAFRLDRRG